MVAYLWARSNRPCLSNGTLGTEIENNTLDEDTSAASLILLSSFQESMVTEGCPFPE